MLGSGRRVAIAGCRETPEAPATVLYPDGDEPRLRDALAEVGFDSVFVAWDDDEQTWSDYDLVVIRSTWDSVDRPAEFLSWAREVSASTTLANPLPALEWNLDKAYLEDLSVAGIAVPTTTFVAFDGDWVPPSEHFVVKPSISGGGRQTARYDHTMMEKAKAHVASLHRAGMTAMIQEYLPGVEKRGEIKLVYIGGTFSHAIRTGPLLRLGAGITDRPWEVSTNPEPIDPTRQELAFAASVFGAIIDRVGSDLLYARIDIVTDDDAEPVLMEAELIDPSLSLWAESGAATALAQEVGRWADRSA